MSRRRTSPLPPVLRLHPIRPRGTMKTQSAGPGGTMKTQSAGPGGRSRPGGIDRGGRNEARRPSSVRPAGPAVNGALALAAAARPVPDQRVQRRLHVVRDTEEVAGELLATALATARMITEVLAGVRPLHQLGGWTSARLYEALTRAGRALLAWGPPSWGSLRVMHPTADSAEVTAIAWYGRRAQAIALRLERKNDRWQCTAFETTAPPRC